MRISGRGLSGRWSGMPKSSERKATRRVGFPVKGGERGRICFSFGFSITVFRKVHGDRADVCNGRIEALDI